MVNNSFEINCGKIRTSYGIHHSNLSNVLELVGLLVKAKCLAIPLIGNYLGHPWKFEPFKAYPYDMHKHTH